MLTKPKISGCLQIPRSKTLLIVLLFPCFSPVVQAQGLPDLAVTVIYPALNGQRLWWVHAAPQNDDEFYLITGVANFGSASARHYRIDLYYDGSHRGPHNSTLAAASAHYWYWGPFTAVEGLHTVRVIVNQDHSIVESDYSNNERRYGFQIEYVSFSQAKEVKLVPVWNTTYAPTFISSFSGSSYQNRVMVAGSSDFGFFATVSEEGNARIFHNGTLMHSLTMSIPAQLALSLNGRYVAVSGLSNTVVYDTQISLTSVLPIGAVSNAISDAGALALSEDGPQSQTNAHWWNKLVVMNLSSSVTIWSKNLAVRLHWAYDLLKQPPPYADVYALSFSNDGNYTLACLKASVIQLAANRQSFIYVLDKRGNIVWTQQFDYDCKQASLSSDGMQIASSSDDGYVYFSDRASNLTWSRLVGVQQTKDTFNSYLPVAISPDGQYLATATSGFVCILDRLGHPVVRFRLANTSSLAISNGLVLAGSVGTAELYSLWPTVDAELMTAEQFISSATKAGLNVSRARDVFQRALVAKNLLKWYDAYSLAKLAGQLAIYAEKPHVSTTTSAIQLSTTQSQVRYPYESYILLIIGVIIVAATSVLSARITRRVRKAIKK